MINLKKNGITNKIGVLCDGNAFSDFHELAIFDGFMMTLNLVDQANYENIKVASDAGLDVVLKRSLANGVFSNNLKARLLRYRRIYRHEIFGGEVQSYDFRSRCMSALNGKQLNFSDYVSYVCSIADKFNSNILIGTKNIKHLRMFQERRRKFKQDQVDFEKLQSLYLLGNSYNWFQKYKSSLIVGFNS